MAYPGPDESKQEFNDAINIQGRATTRVQAQWDQLDIQPIQTAPTGLRSGKMRDSSASWSEASAGMGTCGGARGARSKLSAPPGTMVSSSISAVWPRCSSTSWGIKSNVDNPRVDNQAAL
jgi:hypothetical protein